MALTDESNGNGFYMPVAPAYGAGNGGFGNGFGHVVHVIPDVIHGF